MITIDAIAPKKIPFDTGAGIIYFKTFRHFTMPEQAQWNEAQGMYDAVNKMRENATKLIAEGGNQNVIEQKYSKAAALSERASIAAITLCLPDLPSEILNGLSAGQRDNLAAICIRIAMGQETGMPSAEQLEAVRNRYPDLPGRILGTLTLSQVEMLLDSDILEAEEKNEASQPQTS